MVVGTLRFASQPRILPHLEPSRGRGIWPRFRPADSRAKPRLDEQIASRSKPPRAPTRHSNAIFQRLKRPSCLKDELYYQRAVRVYLWSLPAVNTHAMKEGSEKTQRPCACRPCRGTFRRHRESGIRSTTVRFWRCCSRTFSATSGRRQRSLSAFSRCRCPLHFW